MVDQPKQKYATYHPLSLMPGYKGQFIQIEHAAPLPMPTSENSVLSGPYSPRPDIIATNKIVNMEKMLHSPFMPLTQIDATRRNEIDYFYMACQKHRDQYKDHSGRLHPLDYFAESEYKWQCPPNLTRTYLRYPQYYVKYRNPPMVANNLGRTTPIPNLPNRSLAGRYYTHNDVVYKR